MFVDKRSADFQSRRSFSGTNEFQYSFVIKQRLTCPVVANEGKHTVFDGIPLGGTGRIMTYLDLKVEAVAKGDLQLLFPKADSVAIAAAAIGENEQAVGIRVVARADLLPPCTNRIYGELGSVPAGAYAYIALISHKIIDSVGDRNAFRIRGKIMI